MFFIENKGGSMTNITGYTLNKQNIKLGDMIYLSTEKKDKIEREINILLTPDNNYVQHCGVVMASILLNCDNSSNINFFITDDNISENNKNYLKNLNKIRKFNISFLNISDFDVSMFPLNRKHIKAFSVYYRMIVCDILPKNIDKILYLDCDVIVEKDLKELFDIDLKDYLAGVVEDESSLSNCLRLGINYYFNSGVILFNLTKLRDFDLFKKCTEYFNKNKNLITLQDQDILNGVLSDKCLHLPLKWNASTPVFKDCIWKQKSSINERIKAGLEPGIIHYTCTPKPWNKKCTHILKDEYFKYLKYANIEKYNKYKKNSKIFEIIKTDKRLIITIFGIKIKLKRKSQLRILRDDVEDMRYRIIEIKSKLDSLNNTNIS